MPKFIHLRETHPVQKLSGPVKELSPTGGVTIAYECNANVIVFAFTQCNMLDHFCKRIGRAKAAGRLKSPAYRNSITLSGDGATTQEIYNTLIEKVQSIIHQNIIHAREYY